MFFYFDPLYIVITLIALAISLWASGKVKMNFKKYSAIPNSRGITGAEAAQLILQHQGIQNVSVSTTRRRQIMGMGGDGILDDHYDPRSKEVRLSPQVYSGRSQAALAIAAHEVGHAIQDAKSYAPLKWRSAIAPAAAFGSNMAFFFIFLGFIMNTLSMVKVGIILFSVGVVFQFITLPVEFDASARAKKLLANYGIIQGEQEAAGVAKLLNAAALTYVAAAAAAVMQLLYLLFRSGLLGGSRD